MKNIHVLPTAKPSRLFKFANELHLDNTPKDYYKKYNIYITSDEEIKEGDFFYLDDMDAMFKCKRTGQATQDVKKIILTTDPDLIADGVQAIDDELLEWFVKNPSCEFVSVQKRYSDFTVEPFIGYKIIIPQEEPKQETRVFGTKDDKSFWSDKPKQETPEEAAEKYANDWEEIYPELDSEDITPIAVSKIDFIAGAKWQAERMYSEEDMREAFKANYTPFSATNIGDVEQDFQKWFEQFKKK
jgi:hypothetical protein